LRTTLLLVGLGILAAGCCGNPWSDVDWNDRALYRRLPDTVSAPWTVNHYAMHLPGYDIRPPTLTARWGQDYRIDKVAYQAGAGDGNGLMLEYKAFHGYFPQTFNEKQIHAAFAGFVKSLTCWDDSRVDSAWRGFWESRRYGGYSLGQNGTAPARPEDPLLLEMDMESAPCAADLIETLLKTEPDPNHGQDSQFVMRWGETYIGVTVGVKWYHRAAWKGKGAQIDWHINADGVAHFEISESPHYSNESLVSLVKMALLELGATSTDLSHASFKTGEERSCGSL
jgi:hypothetical protein